jgi:tetratricopeptide (TPR) repeat protein
MKLFISISFFFWITFVTKAQNNYDVAQYFNSLQNAKNLFAQKLWKEAAVESEKVLAINSLQGNIWYNLATSYYNTKEYQKAIFAYQKSTELKYFQQADALYNIACCFALLNKKDSALYYLEKVSSKNPGYRRSAQGDLDFKSVKEEAKFKAITGDVNISNLSREEGWKYDLKLFSNEFKKVHYAPFQQITEKQFDQNIAQIISKINQLTDMQLTVELMKILRRAADAHSGVFANFKTAIPLQFYLFADGVYIISADKKYTNLVGSKVLNVGNSDIANILSTFNKIIPLDNENEQVAKVLSAEFIRIPAFLKALNFINKEENVSLRIEDLEGKTKDIEVKAEASNVFILHSLPHPEGWASIRDRLSEKTPLYLRDPANPYWFEYLNAEKTIYFQYNSVRNNPKNDFKTFLNELSKFIDQNDVEKLVLDLRWNNGGNTYLLPPLLQTILQHEKINRKDKLFCIIGRRTFSAAQNLTSLIERFTNATLVGEPAGSSPNFIGEDSPFILPYSKLSVNFSNLYWQTSTPTDKRSFTAPELLIVPTFADYKIGKDRCLESIFKLK